jgi:hypothetical protein
VCFSNNAAERALRSFALGRKSRLFADSPSRGAREVNWSDECNYSLAPEIYPQ